MSSSRENEPFEKVESVCRELIASLKSEKVKTKKLEEELKLSRIMNVKQLKAIQQFQLEIKSKDEYTEELKRKLKKTELNLLKCSQELKKLKCIGIELDKNLESSKYEENKNKDPLKVRLSTDENTIYTHVAENEDNEMVYSQSYQDNKTNQESIKDIYKRKTNEMSTSNSEAQSQSINVKKENYNPEIITGDQYDSSSILHDHYTPLDHQNIIDHSETYHPPVKKRIIDSRNPESESQRNSNIQKQVESNHFKSQLEIRNITSNSNSIEQHSYHSKSQNTDNQEKTHSNETTNHCDNSTKSPNKILMGNNTETCSNNQSIVKSTIYKVNTKENAFTISNVEIGTGAYVMGNENDRPKIISFTENIVSNNEEAIIQEPEIITTIENNETCEDNIAETDPYIEETNSVGKNEEVFFCDITEITDYENDQDNENLEDSKFAINLSCPHCERMLDSEADLTFHIAAEHKCVCAAEGSLTSAAARPMISPSCRICLAQYNSIKKLTSHAKDKHCNDNDEVKEDACSNNLEGGSSIQTPPSKTPRVRDKGLKKSPACELCGKQFSTEYYLKIHTDICSGVKRYTCTLCTKGFTRENLLRDHIRVHTGELPYHCRICNKSFRSYSVLLNHARNSHNVKSAKELRIEKSV